MHLRNLPGLLAYYAPSDDGGAPPPLAGDPPPAPAPVPAAGDPPAGDPPPPPAPAPKPEKDWKDARIAELTAKLNDAKRAAAANPPPAPVTPAPVQNPGESAEAFEARVAQRAAEIAAMQDWTNRCNAVADEGRKEFTDFDARMGAARSVINEQDGVEVAQFNALIAAALETTAPHKLLHQLGETPGEVKRLMSLPPMKMAMEMAKRAAKFDKAAEPEPPPPSGAPDPITPIGSKGKHFDGLDTSTPNGTKLPIGEWMKQREEHVAKIGIQ